MKSVHVLTQKLVLVFLAAIFSTAVLVAQEPSPTLPDIPMVTDWSHHHLVFSAPDPSKLPLELRREPRYWQQWVRRSWRRPEDRDNGRRRRQQKPFKRDWAMSLGPGGTVGAGQYPAKFSFSITTAHCASDAQPDYVAFNTSLTGSATQASIVAFDNLYSGCTGTVPSTFWAYNTGGKVVTSSVLSIDGTQLAFVQSVSNQAQLVLLRWAASTTATVGSPDPITTVSASQYATCTAPCMTAIPFSGGANDTNSSPFPDYSGDAIYVGDDAGELHKFTPIFRGGTPAEVTGTWPVTVASGLKLNSPVFDSSSARVFVGSGFNGTSGAQLFAVNPSTGAILGTSSSLGKGSGIVASSLVDSSAGKVFVFVGNDGGTTCSGPCDAVYQFPTNFASGSGTKAAVGIGGVAPLYLGAFDNAYYTSGNGTGNLLVCGGGLSSAEPTISRVPISTGVMSTSSSSGPAVSTSNVACSPVTDVFNPQGNVDRVFVGVTTGSDAKICSSGGCITDLLTDTWQASKTYTVGQVVLDPSNFMQVATNTGASGATPPSWIDSCGNQTSDGGVTWVNAGFLTPVTPQGWTANTFWGVGFRILDDNQNIECALNNGSTIHSGATPPTWNTAIGGITNDFTQQWRNGGPMTSHSLPASGGTSGIIIDNVVSPGVLAGASEVYFSMLGTGGCGTGNGCAIQASQSGLN